MTDVPQPPEGADRDGVGQPSPWYRNGRVLAAAVLGAVVIAGVAAWLLAGWEDAYLDELAERGHEDRFTTETEAVNHAENLCAEIEGGGRAEGDEIDALAVEHACPEWADDFTVYATDTFEGTFLLVGSTSGNGETCRGDGGYGDMGSSTTVLVTNDEGDTLDRTDFGSAEPDSGDGMCQWSFELELSEGEDRYIVEVGDRGDRTYTWSELQQDGALEFSLGP